MRNSHSGVGKRYGKVPTHCIRGCGRVLPPSAVETSKWVCNGCRAGNLKRYEGPCLAGCGRRGRARSGLCKNHNHIIYMKRKRREALMTKVLGEYIPLDWLIQFPEDPRAKSYVRRLLLALHEGEMSLTRHVNPTWLWS